MLDDGHVTCPKCSHTFEAHPPREGGASYARRITKLSEAHLRILETWKKYVSTEPIHKEVLRQTLEAFGIKMSPSGFYGRVSELLGLGLIEAIGPRGKDRRYALCTTEAEAVMARGGLIAEPAPVASDVRPGRYGVQTTLRADTGMRLQGI